MIDAKNALALTMREFDIRLMQLARLSGVSATQISEFLHGSRRLNSVNMDKIIRSLPPAARYYYLDLVYSIESGREQIQNYQFAPEPAIKTKLRLRESTLETYSQDK